MYKNTYYKRTLSLVSWVLAISQGLIHKKFINIFGLSEFDMFNAPNYLTLLSHFARQFASLDLSAL